MRLFAYCQARSRRIKALPYRTMKRTAEVPSHWVHAGAMFAVLVLVSSKQQPVDAERASAKIEYVGNYASSVPAGGVDAATIRNGLGLQ